MNRWSLTLGTALTLLAATVSGAPAQQGHMMRGQMHADTAPAAMSCPGGMGMMGMMQGRGTRGGMHGARGMRRGAPGDSAARMPMRRGGMGMMGALPSRLLAQRDALGLTDDQAARLEELQENQQRMMQGMHTGMMAVRSRMQDVMAADSLDMDAYRKALEAMADQMVSHRMQWARFEKQVMDVLTPEQRERVQRDRGRTPGMMRGQGMGGGSG